MAALTNARQEMFCQELAKGKSASEAYETAGFKPNRHNAATLARQEHISTRVAELVGERAEIARKATTLAAERLSVTVESLLAEAEEARQLAMSIDQPAAAIAAIKEKGVLSGMRIEKSERKQTNTNAGDLSDDDLARIAVTGSEGAAAAPSGSRLTH